MGRMVKRLSSLDIDEVSLVDTPANQYGLVAIAKSHQEDGMAGELYDESMELIPEDAVLQEGDLVYDEQGNEYEVQFEDDDDDESAGDFEDEYEPEYSQVGKFSFGSAAGKVAEKVKGAGEIGDEYVKQSLKPRMARYGEKARTEQYKFQANPKKYLGEHKRAIGYGAGGTAAVGAGGGGAVYARNRSKVGKSAGQEFLELISKAVSDEDRDEVIAKVVDDFAEVSKRNEDLEALVLDMYAEQELEQYATVAKGYGPIGLDEYELGGLLQRASHSMDPRDVETIDRLLAAHGQVSKQLYAEQGIAGTGEPGGIMDQVFAVAGDVVSKAGGGITQEQAFVELLQANPDAYDEYEAEQRQLPGWIN